MKKFQLGVIVAFFLVLGAPLCAQPTHPPQVRTSLNMLYRLEESKQLLHRVEADGKLHIKMSHFGGNISNASWIPSERTIYLNNAHPRTPGSIVCSLVFELHNALSDKQFDHYDELALERKISRDEYIAGIEYIEYLNACSTSKILEKGVRQGIFPSDASWPTPPPFEQHFHVQKMAGHSALIGVMYDDLMRASGHLSRN